MEIEIAKILNNMDLGQSSLFMPPEPAEIESTSKNSSPRRSWTIHNHLKCPVIGTCLNMEEQKKMLKKTGHSIKNKSNYEIHTIFINSLSDENKLSSRIDMILNRKFKHEISEYFELDKSLFWDAWKTCFRKGEIAGLLWVAAARTDLTREDTISIFGDIHMQMHLNAFESRKLRQKLYYQEGKNLQLAEKVKDEIRIRRELKKKNNQLQMEQEKLCRKYAGLEKEKLKIKGDLSKLRNNSGALNLEVKNRQLQENLKKISRESAAYEQRVKALQSQNSKLKSKIESQCEINGYLQKEMEMNIAQFSDLNRCDETCPSFDLCQKRILIVGGITKIKDLYKKLIEDNGGVFEYHNGYMNGGPKTLENRVKRADMVLCPININSHNACLTVKKLGKKYSKSVQMLSGSGLGIISQAISKYQKNINIH